MWATRFNDFMSIRLTANGYSYAIGTIYANGRRIFEFEQFLFESPGGCNLSASSKFRFVTFPVLLVNCGLLILPVFLAILLRGLLFDKSWRNKRRRNTFILLLVLVFTLEVNPIPNLGLSLAGPVVNETRLWFVEHVAARLRHMYGSPESVPPLDHRLTVIGAPELVPPASGQAPLKGAMLYFLPNDLKKRIEGVWPTMAKADFGRVPRSQARRGADTGGTDIGGTDIPVGQLASNLKPQTSNLDFAGASDVSRDGHSDNFLSTLARAFLPSEAHATDPPDRYHFFHTDHLGSTRVVTDETGAVYEKIDYLPFGEIFRDDATSGSDDYPKIRNKFTGQMWDYLTGLYYYGARYYDPEMGRFSQADTMVPAPFNPQNYNRYTYAANNPYRFVDPSGHFFSEILSSIGSAVGAAIGMALGAYFGLQGGLLGMALGAAFGSSFGSGMGGAFGGLVGGLTDYSFAVVAGVAATTAMIGSQMMAMAGIPMFSSGTANNYLNTAEPLSSENISEEQNMQYQEEAEDFYKALSTYFGPDEYGIWLRNEVHNCSLNIRVIDRQTVDELELDWLPETVGQVKAGEGKHQFIMYLGNWALDDPEILKDIVLHETLELTRITHTLPPRHVISGITHFVHDHLDTVVFHGQKLPIFNDNYVSFDFNGANISNLHPGITPLPDSIEYRLQTLWKLPHKY